MLAYAVRPKDQRVSGIAQIVETRAYISSGDISVLVEYLAILSDDLRVIAFSVEKGSVGFCVRDLSAVSLIVADLPLLAVGVCEVQRVVPDVRVSVPTLRVFFKCARTFRVNRIEPAKL